MSRLLTLALGAAMFATHHVGAQTGTVQGLWVFPAVPDYTDTLYVGQVYTLRWKSGLADQFAYYCPACDTGNVALYASGGVGDSEVWLINDGISVDATTSLTWLVDVPATQLSDSAQWNLQFVQSGTKPLVNAGQVSSPRIYIKPANVTSTTITGTPTPTSTTTSPPASTGLSTGAKAGIGVGAALGALAVIGAIIFGFILYKRRNNKAQSSSIAQTEQAQMEQAPVLGGAFGGAATENHGGPPEYYNHKDAPYTPYSDAGAGELPVKRPTGEGLDNANDVHELEHYAPTGELEANPLPPQELPAESHHEP